MAVSVASGQGAPGCAAALYRGFDSRLTVSAVGKVPVSREPVLGLAVVAGKPVVMQQNHLIAVAGPQDNVEVASLQPMQGILTDGVSLRVTTPAGPQFLGDRGLTGQPVPGLDSGARAFQNGAAHPLLAVRQGSRTEFSVLLRNGSKVPLVAVEGELHAASWTPAGLAAVAGQTLYLFGNGQKEAEVSAADPLFAQARDVCMTGPSSAVVVFPHGTVLYAHGQPAVVAGISGRCAVDGQTVELYDGGSGIVFKVQGLEQLHSRAATDALVQRLGATAGAGGPGADPAFRELVRLVGSREAAARGHRTDPCGQAVAR